MKTMIAVITLATLGLQAVPAQANHNDRYDRGYDRIEKRLDNQYRRIKHGVRSGELTRKEAKRLKKQQRSISRLKRQFLYDGYLDHFERRTLENELDRASRRIYRLKHNDRYRYSRQYHSGYRFSYHDK